MKKSLLLITLFWAFLATGSLLAQRVVTGTVTDDQGEPLIGANVLIEGTNQGTITDFNGEFDIRVREGEDLLIISYTGYETKQIDITGVNNVDIELLEGVVLDEAVVTALGIRREEKALGYSVQNVDGETIEQAQTTNVVDALNGRVAGLQVTNSSGAAGASSRIVLRGPSSLNGENQALMVVDGVPISNDELTSERTLFGVAYSNRGIDINPHDIESIQVLKGSAATALYGSEGARGVIQITTKKGEFSSRPRVTLNSSYTISEVSQLPPMQDEYAQGFSGVYMPPESGWPYSYGPRMDTLFWNGDEDYPFDPNGRIIGAAEAANDPDAIPVTPYDNLESAFQSGHRISNNLSIHGGGDDISYRVSFGHLNETGVVPKNEFNRYNVGMGLRTNFFDNKMTLDGNVSFTKSDARRIQQGSNTSGYMLGLVRTTPSFDNSAGFGEDAADHPAAYRFPDGSQRNYRGGGGYDNPFWTVNLNPFFDDVQRVYSSINTEYDFAEWFSVGAILGVDMYGDQRKQEFEIGSRTYPSGRVFEDNYYYRHYNLRPYIRGGLDLTDAIGFNYNIGTEFYDQTTRNIFTVGDGLAFQDFRVISNTAVQSVTPNTSRIRNFSLYGLFEFDYDDWVYLTVTGRQEYLSSLMFPNREFDASEISVFYPSVALGLVLSEVIDFPSAINFAKVRLSWAQTGTGAPGSYLTGSYFQPPIQDQGLIWDLNDGWTNGIGFPFNGITGYTTSQISSSAELAPGVANDFEVGLDLRLFRNRLGIDLAYFSTTLEDQIISFNVSQSSGLQRLTANSGKFEKDGFEAVVGLGIVRGPKFSWDLSVNFTTINTEIVSLAEGVEQQYLDGFVSASAYNIPGHPYASLYGIPFQRVNSTDAQGNPSFDPDKPYNPDGALIINDDEGDDFYGFPLADPNSRVIGDPNPDWSMGIGNTFSFMGLSFMMLWDIREGGDLWNGTRGAMTTFGTAESTEDRGTEKVFDGVLASSGETNTIPVTIDENWYTGNGGGFGTVSSHFIDDGSWVRLREARLAYTISQNVWDNAFINGMTISLTARNLLLFTDYEGVDPETSLVGASSNGIGLDYFQMPGIKSYALGLTVDF